MDIFKQTLTEESKFNRVPSSLKLDLEGAGIDEFIEHTHDERVKNLYEDNM
jgi:hypothetical protein